ncbi:mucosal pentraxin-like [Hemicordylus capensis]|uniref:mucosal pentraxin-like n=1 Tax=Hemicordylus capensis TaxID=884348 RepID=UPI00230235C2|nr:mucosal pentraxin-like [Hemicordylus capensis]XP_053134312.1 mucosal pentraxin-like [Hemicordylus capensis]
MNRWFPLGYILTRNWLSKHPVHASLLHSRVYSRQSWRLPTETWKTLAETPRRYPDLLATSPSTLPLANMETLLLSLLTLVSLYGSLAQQDLQGKTFIFPEASNTAYVFLKDTPKEPLTSFTVCLRSYTDLTRTYGLFSYSSRKYDNEILLYKTKPNEYILYVKNQYVTFTTEGNQSIKSAGEHICMSWESATGLVGFWLDGKPFPRKGLKKGDSIDTEAYILLGQEQDSFGGSLDINQSFVGEMEDVYMFDRVLSPSEVRAVYYNQLPSSSLINWRSLSFDIKGYVVLNPSLAS